MAAYRCANTDCAFPDTGVCARRSEFDHPEEQCPSLKEGLAVAGLAAPPKRATEPSGPAAEEDTSKSPPANLLAEARPTAYEGRFWSGYALGGNEAGQILANPRSRLITIVGGQDYGKTCLLTAMYIHLANGYVEDFPWRFAGSRTLRGFQSLASEAFRWTGSEGRILPRTSQGNYRQPSFLHLALAERRGTARDGARDVLLTDVPGEWFQRWIDQGPDAWRDTLEFLPRTDGMIVAVDADQLLRNRGYRKNLEYLLDRVGHFLRREAPIAIPIALTLTKFDQVARVATAPPIGRRREAAEWKALASSIARLLAKLRDLPAGCDWDVFPTVAFSRPLAPSVGVLDPLSFLLRSGCPAAPLRPVVVPRSVEGDSFSWFRYEGGV